MVEIDNHKKDFFNCISTYDSSYWLPSYNRCSIHYRYTHGTRPYSWWCAVHQLSTERSSKEGDTVILSPTYGSQLFHGPSATRFKTFLNMFKLLKLFFTWEHTQHPYRYRYLLFQLVVQLDWQPLVWKCYSMETVQTCTSTWSRNRTNVYEHVIAVHEHLWCPLCSVCAYRARVVQPLPCNFRSRGFTGAVTLLFQLVVQLDWQRLVWHFRSRKTAQTRTSAWRCYMDLFDARFAVFVRMGRVLSNPCHATCNWQLDNR